MRGAESPDRVARSAAGLAVVAAVVFGLALALRGRPSRAGGNPERQAPAVPVVGFSVVEASRPPSVAAGTDATTARRTPGAAAEPTNRRPYAGSADELGSDGVVDVWVTGADGEPLDGARLRIQFDGSFLAIPVPRDGSLDLWDGRVAGGHSAVVAGSMDDSRRLLFHPPRPVTGEAGLYRARLRGALPAYGTVTVEAHGLPPSTVDLAVVEPQTTLRVQLDRPARIRGRFVDACGAGVAWVRLSARARPVSEPARPAATLRRSWTHDHVIRSDGSFETTLALEGPVEVAFQARFAVAPLIVELDLVNGRTYDLGNLLVIGDAELVAHFVLGDGTVARGRRARLAGGPGSRLGPVEGVVGGDGRARFRRLVEGPYELTVQTDVGDLATVACQVERGMDPLRIELDAIYAGFAVAGDEGAGPPLQLHLRSVGESATDVVRVSVVRGAETLLLPNDRSLDVRAYLEGGGEYRVVIPSGLESGRHRFTLTPTGLTRAQVEREAENE